MKGNICASGGARLLFCTLKLEFNGLVCVTDHRRTAVVTLLLSRFALKAERFCLLLMTGRDLDVVVYFPCSW